MPTKQCNACEENKPVDQFRRIKSRQPGWTDRRSWCLVCEREAARQRAARRYRDDPEWRAKKLINSAVQGRKQRELRRQRGAE